MCARVQYEIDDDWVFCRGVHANPIARWLPARNLPTVVHLDLMALPQGYPERIADPFLDLNELDCRWVADTEWTYKCSMKTPSFLAAREMADIRMDLVFKGLDTAATVWFNGNMILQSDNMFVENRIDIKALLNPEEEDLNEIVIQFDPASRVSYERISHGPPHEYHVHQTEMSRAPMRKAQYHWGWDWGPILKTAGPWKPVIWDAYRCRIAGITISPSLCDLETGQLTVEIFHEGASCKRATISIREPDEGVSQYITELTAPDDHSFKTTFSIHSPKLWWPRGHGPQNMYRVDAVIYDNNGQEADQAKKKFSFRQVELAQHLDRFGTSFYFRINGVDIFIGGSCWIPAHSFLPAIDKENGYRRWVNLMAEGNQNMVRVWGGGIYESDAFYDACDEMGVLVWQDFAFACASYPAGNAQFTKSVKLEAEQNVARLHHHPALVIWAGNNEDYQMVEHHNLQYDPESSDPEEWLKTNFPARYLYESVLPAVIRQFYGEESGKTIVYHPGSPFGSGKSITLKVDPTVGDCHEWNVWHGEMRPYQKFGDMGGRFVSAFGMEAYPHISTLQKCITMDGGSQLWPGSPVLDFRNKAIGHQFRLLKYVTENFRIKRLDNLSEYAHLTQVMQADAVAHAYRVWRKQWGEKGARKCGGVLVWQLNDCWPTVSWAVVDHYQVPKPAYYAIKRALAPVVVGVERRFHDCTSRPADDDWHRETGHVEPPLDSQARYDAWVSNSLDVAEGEARITVRYISVATGRDVSVPLTVPAPICANSTTMILKGIPVSNMQESCIGDSNSRLAARDPFVIFAQLLVRDNLIGSDVSWPEPYKYLDFSDRDVRANINFAVGDVEGSIILTAERPTKGVVFAECPKLRFSDNGLDLMPGVPQEIRVKRDTADGEWPQLTYTYVGEE